MRGWYKAKASYKDIPENESYKVVAFRKHDALLKGEAVRLETTPRLMEGKDFSEHLEACDDPSVLPSKLSPEPEAEKSAEPSDNWTKDEIKAYMDTNSIAYNSGDTKGDLLTKCSAPDGGGD